MAARLPAETLERIAAMIAANVPQRTIAEDLHVSKRIVERISKHGSGTRLQHGKHGANKKVRCLRCGALNYGACEACKLRERIWRERQQARNGILQEV